MIITCKEDYYKYLKSKHWINRKRIFWEKHRKVCHCCNGLANQIHHCTYKNIGNEKDEDLVPICQNCHEYITEMVHRGEMKLSEAHEIYRQLLNLSLN